MVLLHAIWITLAVDGVPEGNIPISLALWLGGGMVTAVGVLFKMLIASNASRQAELAKAYAERFAEMARVTETLAADGRAQWRFVERMNHIRVLEIAALPHIAPQIKDDAKEVLKEIDEAEKEAMRKEKR